ncbi:TetR family transcriptional regulator [Saccharomonospora sp. CUA-673]|uniref:TetR/AcrR family transcriptional regulator n=1 Tax=Saccharomonospora sp. CUA-673 TaxID=1904969 RepID=UPI00095AC280|nr:TetR family transcriptional regulator [Saccharomonospora sp. CUA-673]OLT49022.1 TetR family transcriptional regulator [Saccharomonospora sp. CUA-673]
MAVMGEALGSGGSGGGQHRSAIIAAAIEITGDEGWSAVTMARLADTVGVSRQTVYNEVGSKPGLAEAMVAHEADRFLGVVRGAFGRHPGDLPEAIHDAARDVLDLASGNALVRAVVAATPGADTEFLPLLTTRGDTLVAEAAKVLAEHVRAYRTRLTDEQTDVLVDTLVRTVLSHIVQPCRTPAQTADGLAWLTARLLDEGPSPTPLRYR